MMTVLKGVSIAADIPSETKRAPGEATISAALAEGPQSISMMRSSLPCAPDDLNQGHRTQAWLAVSNDQKARVSGKYFYHKQLCAPNLAAYDIQKQDQLLSQCQKLSGITFSE
jgi:hypothetical protein